MTLSKQNTAHASDITRSDKRISALLEHVQRISDLNVLGSLAEWDQNTILPDGAGEVRGAQQATLQGIVHDQWSKPELGKLINELRDASQEGWSDADKGLIREVVRSYDQATKLPRDLVEELARVGAGSFEAWRRARDKSDFASFAPWLTRTVALQREVADRYGYKESRYDALLDLYEPGLTVSRVNALFAPVRETSTQLLHQIQASGQSIDASCLEGDFAPEEQIKLADKILRGMGYDFSRGYMAVSPHPFTSSFGSPHDVRVTVNPDRYLMQACLMAAIHEGGHALYEQGVSPNLTRTPLASGASMGAHESQSRLWENAIGRSEAYWRGQFKHVQSSFPDQFAHVDVVTFMRALNQVKPSLIRIEADEVTYNLHIIIRYELEREMVNGNVAIESMPGMWNAKYREYLGVEPQNDAEGILQDVHWSSGFGYFPTYTLGNLYAAQIFQALKTAFPDFDSRLADGDTSFILSWLQERMYSSGSTYLPETLIKRVTGEAPDPTYFATYLKNKFGALYGLSLNS